MAIARIVTSSPEQVESLVQNLRARGYSVEVVPKSVPSGRKPDLELTVETVSLENALELASQRASEADDTPVFIAAGTFRRTIPAASSSPEKVSGQERTSELPEHSAAANNSVSLAVELQKQRKLLATALRAERARTLEQKRREREERFLQAQQRAEGERRHAEELDNILAKAREQQQQEELQFATDLQDQEVEQIRRADEIERVLAAEWESEPAAQLESTPLPNYERAQTAPSEPTEPLSPGEDLEPQYAFAENAAPYSEATRTEVPLEHSPRSLNRNRSRIRGINFRVSSGRRAREWRAAIIISGLFAIVVAIAWALASREPESPIPASLVQDEQRMEQKVPFGPVKLDSETKVDPQTVPALVEPVSTSVSDPPPRSDRKGPADRGARTAHAPNKHTSQHTVRPKGSDYTADDVVVIHHYPPKKPDAQQKASIKHFSDVE